MTRDSRHTCTTQGGSCALCPACEGFRVTVHTHSALVPKLVTCTHCDSPEAAGNIQRGRPTA